MSRLLISASLLALAGCSNRYDSAVLKLAWDPPPGMKLTEEHPGPPARARFSSGLELYSVDSPPLDLAEVNLETTFIKALSAASAEAPGRLLSKQPGTLPLGPVARFETRDELSRSLVYLIPLKGRFVLLRLTTIETHYGKLSVNVERSLSSLQPKP